MNFEIDFFFLKLFVFFFNEFQLRNITSIDTAEQALTALEMISKRNAKQILVAVNKQFCFDE